MDNTGIELESVYWIFPTQDPCLALVNSVMHIPVP
jgi:hypothetical protein